MSRVRVLIADDSVFMRSAIRRALEADPQIEVVGTARNGQEAVEMAASLAPDVVTLDIEMPVMDGLTALQKITSTTTARVIMLSALTAPGSQAAVQALSMGAADVLAKEGTGNTSAAAELQSELPRRVRAIAVPGRKPRAVQPSTAQRPPLARMRPDQFDAVCIGSSTGGPAALESLLTLLPADLSAPVLIAQHMPAMFTASMCQRFNELCEMPVVHVADAMPIERGKIYIAVGGRHMHVHRRGLTRYELVISDEPKAAAYRPSVDALLESAAHAMGGRTVGIVLTGIGADGAQGAAAIRAKGGIVIAQDEASCVVYGMPKAVAERGAASAVMSPRQIAMALRDLAPSVAKAAA